jgi:hypothetical protein
MVERFFKLSIGVGVLVIWSGIIAAPLVGSSKSFEIAPVLSAGRAVWGWITKAGSDSQQPEANPKPIVEEGKAAVDRLQKSATQGLAQSNITPDPRLSVCPKTSIEPKNVREIPLSISIALKQRIEQGLKPSWMDIQKVLGQPACHIREGKATTWRYLGAEGRSIVAMQPDESQPILVEFVNF